MPWDKALGIGMHALQGPPRCGEISFMYMYTYMQWRVHVGSFTPNPFTCAPILCMCSF